MSDAPEVAALPEADTGRRVVNDGFVHGTTAAADQIRSFAVWHAKGSFRAKIGHARPIERFGGRSPLLLLGRENFDPRHGRSSTAGGDLNCRRAQTYRSFRATAWNGWN
jgi:hypothetical protein